VQRIINEADVLVGFNLKHDLHWLRRYGLVFDHVTVWDVQLAYFNLAAQTKPYPSLNEVSAHYKLGQKLDVVATEYWDKGIDTPDVPYDILEEYLIQDVELTYKCYLKQQEILKTLPKLRTLVRMCNWDLLVLEEMEYNGIKLDVDACKAASEQAESRLKAIDAELDSMVDFSGINWGSGQQLSNVLYGGIHTYTKKEPVKSILKSGKESWRVRNVEYKHSFPKLVEPLDKTKLKTGEYWSTSADVLSQLKAKGKAKRIVDLILERHDLAKMNSTYYKGVPELIKTMQWEDNFIHGNLNQCVAVTGRLSSTKPNMQNMPADFDLMFRSRYD